MNRRARFIFVAAVVSAACRDNPMDHAAVEAALIQAEQPGAVSVYSQNLYIGADVDAVIGALVSPDPEDDVPALMTAIQTFLATDHAARLEAVADLIARRRPHVVGLQEVSVLDIDLTPLGVPVVVHADFLPVLQGALERRGLRYEVAATVRNIDAAPGPGIRLLDYDVLLVDADRVTVGAAGGQNFAVNLGAVAPGVDLKRGWVWADATVDGRPFFFASTHLEGSAVGHPELLAAQAAELAAFLPAGRPVLVMGDFNDEPGSLMYEVMTASGFTDVWAGLRPGADGGTCCHASDLSNPVANLTRRIDYVFERGSADGQPGLLGTVALFGAVPADQTATGGRRIWPSDHVGVVATVFAAHGGHRR